MDKILLVEDSAAVGLFVKRRIEADLQGEVQVDWARTLSEARDALSRGDAPYFAALVNLQLPDCTPGEGVDLAIAARVATIALTSDLDEDARRGVWSRGVADYILMEGEQSLDQMVSTVRRLYRNRGTRILIVDDSPSYRMLLESLLRTHLYEVRSASDGPAALQALADDPEIRMVITDYNMPGMDGCHLTRCIRATHRKDDMAIIGISASEDSQTPARFLKSGANDFVTKPLSPEEFYCRVGQTMEMVELVQEIRATATRDYLTHLHNRRFLFEAGVKILEKARRDDSPLVVAMMDIDYFKKVNDTYGHQAGDHTLVHVARLLQARFRTSDVVSRFGGEEFCVLAPGMGTEHAFRIFDEVRAALEATAVETGAASIRTTISIGVCTTVCPTLEGMINRADALLYQAKAGGRNRVVIDVTE